MNGCCGCVVHRRFWLVSSRIGWAYTLANPKSISLWRTPKHVTTRDIQRTSNEVHIYTCKSATKVFFETLFKLISSRMGIAANQHRSSLIILIWTWVKTCRSLATNSKLWAVQFWPSPSNPTNDETRKRPNTGHGPNYGKLLSCYRLLRKFLGCPCSTKSIHAESFPDCSERCWFALLTTDKQTQRGQLFWPPVV